MSSGQEMAADVHGAVDTEVICVAASTTPGNMPLGGLCVTPLGATGPAYNFLNGRWIDVTADGCDLYYLLSDITTGINGATTGNLGATQLPTGPVTPATGARGIPQLIPKDTTKSMLVGGKNAKYTNLQFVARSGTGFIRVSPSSPSLNGK